MRTFLFLLTALLLHSTSTGQTNHRIEGAVQGMDQLPAYLIAIRGGDQQIIDTTYSDPTGAFTFEMTPERIAGTYLVAISPDQTVELIYNHEDITFTASGFDDNDQVQIIASIENMLWYQYLYLKGSTMQRLDLLKPLIQRYPPQDPFYQTIMTEYLSLQSDFHQWIADHSADNAGTLASRLMVYDEPSFAPPAFNSTEENQYMRSHFFDHINFSDTTILRSNVLTGKIIQYLSLWQYNVNDRAALERNMITAVDSLLSRALVNQDVYIATTEFLIKGFEGIGFEAGLEHIANLNDLENFCENTDAKQALSTRLEQIRRMAPGQPAPALISTNLQGQPVDLNSLKSKTTVVVFWASWCPHCDEWLPVIRQWYDRTGRDQLEVIAISVDSDGKALDEAIKTNDYRWINIGELKGWDGKLIIEWAVAATPTVYILGPDHHILSKPSSLKQLNADLSGLLQ